MQKNKHDRSLQPAINKSRTETLKNPGQSCFYSPVLLAMLMKILLPCRHSAPDMPLRFVRVQNLARFPGKGRVDLEEPFGDVWWCQGRNKKINYFTEFYFLRFLIHPYICLDILLNLELLLSLIYLHYLKP